MNITKLFIFPVAPEDKKSAKSPDYRVTAQTAGGFVDVGAGWKAETKDHKRYISVSLKEVYEGNAGYKLIEDYDPHTKPTQSTNDVDWGV